MAKIGEHFQTGQLCKEYGVYQFDGYLDGSADPLPSADERVIPLGLQIKLVGGNWSESPTSLNALYYTQHHKLLAFNLKAGPINHTNNRLLKYELVTGRWKMAERETCLNIVKHLYE